MGRIPARSLESKDLISAIAVWKQLALSMTSWDFSEAYRIGPSVFKKRTRYEGNIVNAGVSGGRVRMPELFSEQ